MSIAEKLTRIAENEQKVFEAGKSEGEKECWDNLTNNGQRVDYRYGFYNWGGEYFRPARKIVPTNMNSANNTFYGAKKLKKIEAAYLDMSQKERGTNNQQGYYYTFYGCSVLEEVEDIGMQADYAYNYTFGNCTNLHTIAKIRCDENTRIDNPFAGVQKLKNITFEGVIAQSLSFSKLCTELSKASIENIIGCLSSTASGKTLSLSQTAVNNAFTDAEWTALADTKKNWTISLL